MFKVFFVLTFVAGAAVGSLTSPGWPCATRTVYLPMAQTESLPREIEVMPCYLDDDGAE